MTPRARSSLTSVRLELDPESAFTVDCLTELYEAKRDAKRLVELYVQRVELSSEETADLKYTLLISAAALYERELSDRSRAIEVLGQALAVRPGDPGVLATLNRLYRVESMWPELLDNLRLEAAAASVPEERARLRKEIGSVLASKLESFDDALEAQPTCARGRADRRRISRPPCERSVSRTRICATPWRRSWSPCSGAPRAGRSW